MVLENPTKFFTKSYITKYTPTKDLEAEKKEETPSKSPNFSVTEKLKGEGVDFAKSKEEVKEFSSENKENLLVKPEQKTKIETEVLPSPKVETEEDFLSNLLLNLKPIDLPKPQSNDFVSKDLKKSSGQNLEPATEQKPEVKPQLETLPKQPLTESKLNQQNLTDSDLRKTSEIVKTLKDWGFRSKSANQLKSIQQYVSDCKDIEKLYQVVKSIELDEKISFDRKASYVENRYNSDFTFVLEMSYDAELESERKAFKNLFDPVYKAFGYQTKVVTLPELCSNLSGKLKAVKEILNDPELSFRKKIIANFEQSFNFLYETGKLDRSFDQTKKAHVNLLPEAFELRSKLLDIQSLEDLPSYFQKNFPKLAEKEFTQVSLFFNIFIDFVQYLNDIPEQRLEAIDHVSYREIFDSYVAKFSKSYELSKNEITETQVEDMEDMEEVEPQPKSKVVSFTNFRETGKDLKPLNLDLSNIFKGLS